MPKQLASTGVGGAGSVEWYRAGGAPAPVGAYQAIGAASQAASYINLIAPGTNNLAPNVAPTWSAATGWNFNGVANEELHTGLTPAAGWTGMVQYSDGNAGGGIAYLFGSFTGGNDRFLIRFDEVFYYYGDNFIDRPPELLTGNLCIAASQPYRNGSADGADSGNSWSGAGAEIYIGRCNGIVSNSCIANIRAVVFYSATLTAPQVAAVAAAMAALPG